jgi:uncharacterized protein
MPSLRHLLNKIKWTQNLENVTIWYRNRGSPNNMKSISGNQIIKIDISFLETPSASIPYHRILKIIYDEHIIFDRNTKKS